MRRQPMTLAAEKLPVSSLKHFDDQTLLALLAVQDALAAHNWPEKSFADWGVLACSSFFGRAGNAQAVQRFQQEGAWGVSPNMIPHHSLHAVAGTISQALKMHGPNFGVGCGAVPGPEAILLAAAMIGDQRLPGLWLVLTGWQTEFIPEKELHATNAPACHAVALALTPMNEETGPTLLVNGVPHDGASSLGHMPEFNLHDWIAGSLDSLPSGRWRLTDRHWLEIESSVLAAEGRA